MVRSLLSTVLYVHSKTFRFHTSADNAPAQWKGTVEDHSRLCQMVSTHDRYSWSVQNILYGSRTVLQFSSLLNTVQCTVYSKVRVFFSCPPPLTESGNKKDRHQSIKSFLSVARVKTSLYCISLPRLTISTCRHQFQIRKINFLLYEANCPLMESRN